MLTAIKLIILNFFKPFFVKYLAFRLALSGGGQMAQSDWTPEIVALIIIFVAGYFVIRKFVLKKQPTEGTGEIEEEKD